MKPLYIPSTPLSHLSISLNPPKPTLLPFLSLKPHFPPTRHTHFQTLCFLNKNADNLNTQSFITLIKSPTLPPFVSSLSRKFTSPHHALFLLTFLACTASAALVSFVAAAVPALNAMGKAANSFAKLADTAREELPSTMSSIRLSSMEVSDLTLELSDLSHEITQGVSKSAQAVQAAEVGMRQIGARAREQTVSLIQERANLPVISLKPVVSGAAQKTSRAVSYAAKTILNIVSRGEVESDKKENGPGDR